MLEKIALVNCCNNAATVVGEGANIFFDVHLKLLL